MRLQVHDLDLEAGELFLPVFDRQEVHVLLARHCDIIEAWRHRGLHLFSKLHLLDVNDRLGELRLLDFDFDGASASIIVIETHRRPSSSLEDYHLFEAIDTMLQRIVLRLDILKLRAQGHAHLLSYFFHSELQNFLLALRKVYVK